MINRKFLRILGLICFIPSFFSCIAVLMLTIQPEPVKINLFDEIIIWIGVFAWLFYLLSYGLLILSDDAWWNTRRELQSVIQKYEQAKLRYNRLYEALHEKIEHIITDKE